MCALLTPGQRRRYQQELRELQGKYDGLTKHVAALDKELGQALDVERRVVLEERLVDRRAERDNVAARMSQIEAALSDSPPSPPDSSDRPPDDPAVERRGPRSRRPLVAVLGTAALVMLVVLGVIVYDQINPAQKSVTPTAQKETPTPRPLQTLSTDGAACDPETDLVPNEWPVLLSDDFGSIQNGWALGPYRGQDFSYVFALTDGEYEWKGDWKSDIPFYTVIPNNSTPANQDFFASVELTLVEGPPTLDYGILFRNQRTRAGGSYGSNLRVGLQGNGGFVQLQGTESSQSANWRTPSNIELHEKHRLELMGLGSCVHVWLDGQWIGAWPDGRSPVPTGSIGLYFALPWGSPATATVRFDNFEVRAP